MSKIAKLKIEYPNGQYALVELRIGPKEQHGSDATTIKKFNRQTNVWDNMAILRLIEITEE